MFPGNTERVIIQQITNKSVGLEEIMTLIANSVTREDFERAIRERPNDSSTHHIFADWLEENGHDKEAEHHRIIGGAMDKLGRLWGTAEGARKMSAVAGQASKRSSGVGFTTSSSGLLGLRYANYALESHRAMNRQNQEYYHSQAAEEHRLDASHHHDRAIMMESMGNKRIQRIQRLAELAHRQAIAAHHAAVVGMGLRPRFGHFEG